MSAIPYYYFYHTLLILYCSLRPRASTTHLANSKSLYNGKVPAHTTAVNAPLERGDFQPDDCVVGTVLYIVGSLAAP